MPVLNAKIENTIFLMETRKKILDSLLDKNLEKFPRLICIVLPRFIFLKEKINMYIIYCFRRGRMFE